MNRLRHTLNDTLLAKLKPVYFPSLRVSHVQMGEADPQGRPPEFPGLRRMDRRRFAQHRGPAGAWGCLPHSFSALWSHTMLGQFPAPAGGILKRLDLGRNTAQDVGP